MPEVDYRTTSHRVLTMEFIDGVGVTDVVGLRRLGVSPASVSRLVGEGWGVTETERRLAGRRGQCVALLWGHGGLVVRPAYAGWWRGAALLAGQ